MIKIFLICIILSVSVCQQEIDVEKDKVISDNFDKFCKSYNRTYASKDEWQQRLQIFKDNYLRLESNLKTRKYRHSQGISQFSDLMPQEFSRIYLNLNITMRDLIKAQNESGSLFEEINKEGAVYASAADSFLKANADTVNSDAEGSSSTNTSTGTTLRYLQTLPTSFDWRSYGAVGFIKNQGSCGSCWAFSATANIESQYFLKYRVMENFSEQQLLNCDSNSSGCSGGTSSNAFNYLYYYSNGQVRESQLPYVGYRQICNNNGLTPVAKISSWRFAGTLDENYIAQMLLTYGPLATAINANFLQYYRGGIIDENSVDCSPLGINHAVNFVGFGEENGLKFWIVQNSWGKLWGESGFFRIARGKGTCGINKYVITAFVK